MCALSFSVTFYQYPYMNMIEKSRRRRLAGPEPTLFGKPKFCCMRLHYRSQETSGYFHTLRAATRNPEDDGKGD